MLLAKLRDSLLEFIKKGDAILLKRRGAVVEKSYWILEEGGRSYSLLHKKKLIRKGRV